MMMHDDFLDMVLEVDGNENKTKKKLV